MVPLAREPTNRKMVLRGPPSPAQPGGFATERTMCSTANPPFLLCYSFYMKFFDIHSHLQDKAYDADRDEVVARMKEGGTTTIFVGTDRKMSEDAVMLAQMYDLSATIGQHPTDIPDEIFDYDFYKKLAAHPRVVGIGECGIDYYRITNNELRINEKERQKELFRKQVELAVEVGKPLMIHGRPTVGTQDAYDDILDVLRTTNYTLPSGILGNVHFFAGNWDTAQKFLKLGFTLSFTGVITFTHDYDDVIKNSPLDMILTETDAPYVSPVPHRGKRNEPLFVQEVVRRMAEIRQDSFEKVAQQTVRNAERVFGVSARH